MLANYAAQGVIAGLGALMVAVLAQRGVPLESQVGVLAGGAVPWALKFVVALLLDMTPSWRLRRRGAALGATLVLTAACLQIMAMAWSGGEAGLPRSLVTVAGGWVALNLVLATQDVIVDGLALDALGEHRALAGTLMGLGHALGFGLITPLLLTPRLLEDGAAAALALPIPWLAVLVPIVVALCWMPGTPAGARVQTKTAGDHRYGPLLLLAVLLAFVLVMLGPNLTQAVSAQLL
ncbi:MAG: hypothetical protein KC431_01260, partial [Myxococcales bacterium]|nr:hypothetical protein [Myxococcales bacterium]